jgi:hypothetical protein
LQITDGYQNVEICYEFDRWRHGGTTGFAGEATRLALYDRRGKKVEMLLEKRKPNFEKNGCRNSVISVQFLVFSHKISWKCLKFKVLEKDFKLKYMI